MSERPFFLVHLLIMSFIGLIVLGVLLLLVLRLATWLIKKFPWRPEQRVSVAGVIIGGIADIFASTVLGLPLFLYLQAQGSGIPPVMHSGGWLYWLQLSIGLGCSALGGYVAARVAKQHELLNGLLSSFLCAALGLYSILLGKRAEPWLPQILLLASAPAFALIGGYLRHIQKNTNREPGILGPVA